MDNAYYKTLQPLIDSGHMQAAIDGTYKFPKGVNLFPGISCMFECSFCGRNYDARHPKYNYFYERLLDQDPKDNPYRYNISGGLEPLTYHEIDRLCKDLYDRGFKSRLVTNGFLLTTSIRPDTPAKFSTLSHIFCKGISVSKFIAATDAVKLYTLKYPIIEDEKFTILSKFCRAT